ncbi:hypothetical protein G6045_10925 [Streptomyces sp. YC504]|uniref:Uncharacterized protein n=1 Tax=Streptomyces mesophilus TaxID=1775132 RepID=A0A6G4XF30_9ACTN|nr:hypothetical protein [Streptomyces mesophilus]NGO76176.1 hypothetical protein [Streptomyces mesophilus]
MAMDDTHPSPFPDAAADRAGAVASVADTATRYLSEFSNTSASGYQLDPVDREIVTRMSNSVSTVMSLATQATREASAILADDTLYPEGRNRLAREAKEAAAQKTAEAFEQFETDYLIAEASLYEQARPKVHRAEAASARMDAQMLLDGALNREGASLTQVLQRLARRQDAVGALVSSEWLTDYAMARGMDPDVLDASRVLLRQAALEGAAESGDSDRVAAARTALSLRSLRQAQIAARSFVRMSLS